jgi:predicted small lipoprotein YifL
MTSRREEVMKVKIFDLLVVLAMVLGLAACGALAPAPVSTPTPEPTEAAPDPTATAVVPTTRLGAFSQEHLIEDAWQLAEILESAHPDPYLRGGGRIAFHRRLQRLLEAIPAEGMTRDEFIRLLRPFIGTIGDSHTNIWSDYGVNDSSPGG